MKSIFIAASMLVVAGCTSADLVSSPTVQSNDQFNRQAEIINDTDVSLTRLRVQNATTLSWSGNILIGKIRRNTSQIVLIDDGTGQCLYNFHATMDNGAKVTRRGLDVCQLASWRIFRR